ncbi:MAG: PQQ-dependent sugar dehydrogenase [Emticicia sp.]|nr:PQQ-dependent sugar dehydrogenase [Emticicia sp.]
MKRTIIYILSLLFCANLSIFAKKEAFFQPIDSLSITKGQTLFTQNCTSCHQVRTDGIGPRLSGIVSITSPAWVKKFIKNSQEVIAAGDERATEVFLKYKKAMMPSYSHLQEAELDAIVDYLGTTKPIKNDFKKDYGEGLKNPIPEPIEVSNLVIDVKQFTQFPASSENGKYPLTRITKFAPQPVTGQIFVNDLRGKLYKMEGQTPVIYMDFAQLMPNFIHQPGLASGLGSFAFHPDFLNNGLLYTTHSEKTDSGKADFAYADSIKVSLQWVLTEWKIKNPASGIFSGKPREMMRVNVVMAIHGVQEIAFNPMAKKGDTDYGFLYIGIGDGGAAENGYSFLTNKEEQIWGKILRIDPSGRNSKNGKYGIPATNPYVKSANKKALKEIYASGFRNPHRIMWTSKGDMLTVNIGHVNIESLYKIEAGRNYGWPIREGKFVIHADGDMNQVYALPTNDKTYDITYPVATFDHDEAKAITGGFEYTGSLIPALKGKYLFGDIPTGRLFYLNTADLKQGQTAKIKEWKLSLEGKPETLRNLCGSDRIDLHFGIDAKGEMYIMTKADGRIYQIVGAKE